MSRDRRLSEEKHLVNKPRRHRSERQRDRHDGRRKSRDSQEEKVYSISTIGRNGTFDSHKTYDSHAGIQNKYIPFIVILLKKVH